MNVTYKLAANGLCQFFIHAYYGDGSVAEFGPFASGEEAVAEIGRMEAADEAAAEAQAAAWDEDMEQLAWAEAGGYAAGLPRPVLRHPSFVDVYMCDDIPF